MATRPRVRFSETPEPHKNPEPQQQQQSSGWSSWLFGGRKSKEENNNNYSRVHNTVQVSPQVPKVGERRAAHPADGRTIKISQEEDDEVEEEHVDTEAEDFIARQRKKLEMERMISMKRVESMLNRGL
uniref:Uncharacterized protein n=1 Tax=Picea sitchensis TaxID=3332 RepID=A9NMP3_PICSI|nr:unknown [Picea sitchensis]ABK27053.1 unknown [Picea sitchensis]